MKKTKELLELAMIGVILGDHFANKLYEKMRQKGTGYVSTAETIAEWSVNFYIKHKNTDWESVLENGMKPLSNEMSSIISFDEAVIDFGYYQLNKFK